LSLDEHHGTSSSLVNSELIPLHYRFLLGSNTKTARQAINVSVLNDSIDVVLGLSWNLLASADANIRDKTALEVLLEELPYLLGTSMDLAGIERGDPD